MIGEFKPIVDKDEMVYFDLEEVLIFIDKNGLTKIWNEYVNRNSVMAKSGIRQDGKRINRAILITDYAKFEEQYIN